MTYYNDKWEVVANPDLSAGQVVEAQKPTLVREAYTEDVEIDREHRLHTLVERPAEYTYETVMQYIPYTTAERLEQLKAQLAASDYKAIKYAEGWYTEDEYAPIKAARQAIRDKINELEGG